MHVIIKGGHGMHERRPIMILSTNQSISDRRQRLTNSHQVARSGNFSLEAR